MHGGGGGFPWQRIHVDFAGPVAGKMLLVAVDAHSKGPEVISMASISAEKTISVLRELFARLGLPEQLVTDNGPQFISREFTGFMASLGIKHLRSAPYHPASSGAAERLVQTVKLAILAGEQSGAFLEQSLAAFRLQYRNTPHATTGQSIDVRSSSMHSSRSSMPQCCATSAGSAKSPKAGT